MNHYLSLTMKQLLVFFLLLVFAVPVSSNEIPLVSNIYSRNSICLNGKWNYIIDPLENGYYDYRLEPSRRGFFLNRKSEKPSDLVEYNFDTSPTMDIPSDWNSKDHNLFFYEGTVWFKKDFEINKKEGVKYILYFGAINYESKVYVNGKKVGEHVGGFTPFNFDITDFVEDGNNFVIVKADNTRHRDAVPTVNTDWWNYGGITRDVFVTALPETYIEDYLIQLNKNNHQEIAGMIKLNKPVAGQTLTLEIPELKVKRQFTTDVNGQIVFDLKKVKPVLWSPENPKLYDIIISKDDETITDRIGFRSIETQGKKILLNGKHTFLRGISIHEEAPFRQGRAWSREDAATLLGWAKELGCNYVRLAHYPHNEHMVRVAEELGLMVWSEIPVYWTISWENEETYRNAEKQLHDMIYRDKNRAAVVIWSIANETPHGSSRDAFLSRLAAFARSQDSSRLISMAMEVTFSTNNMNRLKDNMSEHVDIISFNQYIGWYRNTPEEAANMIWKIPYDKPVIISEFGGGALQGKHGDKGERWTEEYQEELYRGNLEMMDKIEGFSGVTPWILVDFRSSRRQLPGIQDYFNRKGLISNWGIRKKAFYVLQDFYRKKKEEFK